MLNGLSGFALNWIGHNMIAGKRILLVEDEFMVAAMICDVIEDAGAIVVGPVANIADALDHVARGGFDLAVLDWNLDGDRSDPIARALIGRRVPFVISSGYGAVPEEFAGAPLLSKPYDPANLVRRLAALATASDA